MFNILASKQPRFRQIPKLTSYEKNDKIDPNLYFILSILIPQTSINEKDFGLETASAPQDPLIDRIKKNYKIDPYFYLILSISRPQT